MALGGLGHVHIHFFGQEDGARERAPVELALVVVLFIHFALVLAR